MVFPIIGGDGKPTGYNIDNSLRFDGDNDRLTHTRGTATNEKKFTFSTWVKLGLTGFSANGTLFGSGDDGNGYTGDMLAIQTNGLIKQGDHDSSTDAHNVRTNAVLRDQSAWYHIVAACDSTQGTDSNRIKLYINGTQQTSLAASTYPSQNITFDCNTSGQVLNIGRNQNGENHTYFEGYMAETVFIDGQQLAPSSFAETDDNGVWIPKDISTQGLTFGNNGFYLQYQQSGDSANSSGKGADTSGEDNHLAPVSMGSVLPVVDTPTNNFAVFRPHGFPKDSRSVITNGNTDFDFTGDGSVGGRRLSAHVVSNIGVTQGKWYAEFKLTEDANGGFVGVSNLSNKIHTGDIDSYNYLNTDAGNKYVREKTGESESNAAHGGAVSVNDIVQVALDADNRNVYFGKGGSWASGSGAWNQATPTSAVSYTADFVTTDSHGVVVFNAAGAGSSETPRWLANFGNPVFTISSGNSDANGYGLFEYAVPSGYYALCTKNLAEYG